MGFPTKVQLIKRKASEQWYINFPSAIAQAMEFARGETVEWLVEDKALLALRRLEAPAPVLKKTPPASSLSSSNSAGLPPRLRQQLLDHGNRAEFAALPGRHTVTGLHLSKDPSASGPLSWRRDPLGPRFHTNFAEPWLSLTPGSLISCATNAVRIDVAHCRSRTGSATGGHCSVGVSSAEGIEAAVSRSRLPHLYRPGTGPAPDYRSLFPTLGHRGEFSR